MVKLAIVNFPIKKVIFHSYVSLPEGIFGVPSGKRLQKTNWKDHHATNGKTHYKSMAMFNSKLFVYQRVPGRNGALLSALTTDFVRWG